MRRSGIALFACASVLTLAFAPTSCGVGGGSQFGDDDDSGSGSGTGGAGGGLTISSSNAGGSGNFCTEPGCVGNEPQGDCDTGIAIDPSEGMDGARAMGLCKQASGDSWGVVSAEWLRADGQPLAGGSPGSIESTDLSKGKGVLPSFGNAVTPREGAAMLALSSGSARAPGNPDYVDPGGNWKDTTPHGAPPGYPKESPACPGVTTGSPYDSAGLKLVIKTPLDAKSFTFDFNFYTYEYPDYICDQYNDYFVAMLSPTPMGLPDGNISFDEQGNTISVNAGFLQACQPCNTGGKNFTCPLGYGEILGTGFDSNSFTLNCGIQGSAGTSWLTTTAPVENPGENIELFFAIWDSGDGVLDSTVLIDNFRFELTEGEVGTIPTPK